ncbi:MAG TPA: recombinase family protein, partial [Bellilinea sp.]|nr:recombinase family protein [Bellilinea sp.]
MSDQHSLQAVIYCRVSSIKQKTVGDGLNSQETRCRDFARMHGYDVLDVFADDVSGSLIDRPAMKAMLAFIRKRRSKGTIVIIDDVSRLARGLEAHLELRTAIEIAGGTLKSPSIEFGKDPDSILVENLLASVSQHQRQKNGEQTKNRMKARVQNGYCVTPAPIGYRYGRVNGRGKLLMRHEPVASVIQEALEGYASSRFGTQADVMRFLQDNPMFPKGAKGIVTNQRVAQILNQPLYAGYLEMPSWDISLRPAQHEALVSFQVWQRIQDRLSGGFYAPRKTNVNEDFPLRGHVACDDCGTPLTACWSKGSHQKHPYYLCPKRGCPSYGKSIRRAKIEGEFEALLKTLVPSEKLVRVAGMMFRDLWNHRLTQSEANAKAMASQIIKVQRQIDQLLDRIADVTVASVMGAIEKRIEKLEYEKLALQERMAESARPKTSFDKTLRTALSFLANPWNLWASGQLDQRKAVLKLAFP